jgi:tRNA pseudouridine55 synthase
MRTSDSPSSETPQDRVILVNKPLHWTSFDVVRKVRNKLKLDKVGHAGTLDPLASGLLILCSGKMTKNIDQFQAEEKEYTGTFRLGQTTASYDLETPPTPSVAVDHLTIEKIKAAAKSLTGAIEQVPPLHSAIKVEGRRAYQLARKGQDATLKSRPVTISMFDIVDVKLPDVSFRVICSKGTYIRSLARDFGDALGTGAYLSSLCRTRIGNFLLTDAIEIDELV